LHAWNDGAYEYAYAAVKNRWAISNGVWIKSGEKMRIVRRQASDFFGGNSLRMLVLTAFIAIGGLPSASFAQGIHVTYPSCNGRGAPLYSGDYFLGCYNISGTSGIRINTNPGNASNPYYQTTTGTTIANRDPTKKCGVGNPIIPSTGNKIEEETDFESSGEMPLSLMRTYNRYWQGAGLFGQYWVSNLDYKLSFGTTAVNACYPRPGGGTCGIGTNTIIYAWRPSGSVIKYTKNAADGVFYEDKPSPVAKIVPQADGRFVLYGEDSRVETYSSAGYVSSINNEQGIGWTYTYINTTYPYRVTHTSGRYVEFTWTNGQLTAVRDPGGNYFGYSYTANAFGAGLHRLESTFKPGQPATTITYHYPNSSSPYLLGKSFGGIRYSTFGYDGNGYATSTEHSGLDKYTFAYTEGANGLLTVLETNPRGKKTTYIYKNGAITSVTGQPSTYCPDTTYGLTEYDSNGYPIMKSDFNNNKTAYAYNAKGQLSQMIEAYNTPQARTTLYAWSATRNRLASVEVVGSRRTQFAYTADHRVASVTETNLSANGVANQSRVTAYLYTAHANGMLASMTVDGPIAGSGDAVVTSYSAQGDVISVTNSLGHATIYSNHNGLGQPGRITGTNGDIVDYLYDAQGRIITERRWIAGVAADTASTYNAQGLRVAVTTPDGVTTNYEYDNARRTTRAWRVANGTVASGASKEDQLYSYDAMGNLIQIDSRKLIGQYESQCIRWRQTPEGPECMQEQQIWVESPIVTQRGFIDYDELGRVRARRGNNGQETRYTYDPNGNVKTVRDALFQFTTMTYDALDRLITSTDPLNNITRFEYDASDRITKVTDPKNLNTTYVYDGFGQLWAQYSPDTGTSTFQYDASGLRTHATRHDGSALSYTYDAVGRLTWYGTGTQGRAYGYDWCNSGKGRLCEANYGQGTRHYGYTPEGQIAVTRDVTVGLVMDDWTGYSYDNMGRLTGISYPSGVGAGYGYNNGKLTTMTATIAGATQIVAGSINYQPFGGINNWTYGNSLQRLQQIDLDGRLTAIHTDNVQGLYYQHNANDEITQITNGADASLTQTYAYDALSRLTQQNLPGNTFALGYDATGNRTARTDNGVTTNYVYPATSHKLQSAVSPSLSRSFNTNGVGNIDAWTGADGASNSTTYDAYQRLKTHTRNSTITTTYQYDALDQRVAKTAGIATTHYSYGGQNQLMTELTRFNTGAKSAWTTYLWLGGQPVGLVKGNTMYWVHPDHLGRPEMVTNASGQRVWRAANWAFNRGIVQDGIGGYNLGFPGQYYDAESNLWHNGFRDYEPTLGRYLQSDPIGLAGGVNTYVYVMNSPINSVDSLGLEACLLTTVGPGGVRDHAAIYTSRGDGSGGAAIYDPAGAFGAANGGGEGAIVTGDAASIDKFRDFHKSQTVEATCKNTSKAEEESIINKAMTLPYAEPFDCAIRSSTALSGHQSFRNVEAGTFWPGNLLRQVRDSP
jgi:RHS repeat-associated protein